MGAVSGPLRHLPHVRRQRVVDAEGFMPASCGDNRTFSNPRSSEGTHRILELARARSTSPDTAANGQCPTVFFKNNYN